MLFIVDVYVIITGYTWMLLSMSSSMYCNEKCTCIIVPLLCEFFSGFYEFHIIDDDQQLNSPMTMVLNWICGFELP